MMKRNIISMLYQVNMKESYQISTKLFLVEQMCAKNFPFVKVICNQVPPYYRRIPDRMKENSYYDRLADKVVVFPRVGAFEIVYDDIIIHSKLKSGRWPNCDSLVQCFTALIHRHEVRFNRFRGFHDPRGNIMEEKYLEFQASPNIDATIFPSLHILTPKNKRKENGGRGNLSPLQLPSRAYKTRTIPTPHEDETENEEGGTSTIIGMAPDETTQKTSEVYNDKEESKILGRTKAIAASLTQLFDHIMVMAPLEIKRHGIVQSPQMS